MENNNLENYIKLAEMLSESYGSDCEVIIYNLENTAIYISKNNFTNTEIGMNLSEDLFKILEKDLDNKGYKSNFYYTKDGKIIKASFMPIKLKKKIIGSILINFKTEEIIKTLNYLESHLENYREFNEKDENVVEIVEKLIDKTLSDVNVEKLNRKERIEKIKLMNNKGIFNMKGSIDYVAKRMNIKSVTVYSYIDEIEKSK